MKYMENINICVKRLSEQLQKKQCKLAVAESCTGGSLAAALTHQSGSSQWFDRGFVTYSNTAKEEMLGVRANILEKTGAVSEAAVRAMAEGAILHSEADCSVAISGIAGPTGGTPEKPVGTVWIAFSGFKQPTTAICYCFSGHRKAVRDAAVLEALKGLLMRIHAYTPTQTVANAPITRYFFALWPDETTQNMLYQHAQPLIQAIPCQPSLMENLHLTLAYLGPLRTEASENLKHLDCNPIMPFELKLTHALHSTSQKLAYFYPEPSDPLHHLHAFLNQFLLKQGFKPERRAFKPHITFARQYSHPLETCLLKPIHWFIHHVCLVASTPHPHLSHYEIIKRTPLPLKTC